MRQCCGCFSTSYYEKLKHAILVHLSAYHRAPFTLLLLACAAACGSAFAQQGSVSQQTSQSDSKTPVSGIPPAQVSSGAYLGVYLGDLTAERASELKLKEIRGAFIGSVEDNSPAAKFGLQKGDVILAFNAHRVQNRAHFYRLLMDSRPGSKISLGISRGGAEKNLDVIMGESRSPVVDERERLFKTANAFLKQSEQVRKEAEEARRNGEEKRARELFEQAEFLRKESDTQRADIEEKIRAGVIKLRSASHGAGYDPNANRYQLGVRVTPLTPQLAGFFNAPNGAVLITEVTAGELGERHGLKAGDCVVTIDGEAVKSASDLNRLVGQKSSGELEFVIVRDRGEQKIKIKLDQK